ncbi:MAG: DNA mismatch repair protein MutS [Ferruginibacter sp.]
METDKITLGDLSIFSTEEESSVFYRLNFTRTVGGREQLHHNFSTPLLNIEAIEGVQQTLKYILEKETAWPMQISNGTIMMVEKFYESTLDLIPAHPSPIDAYVYKTFHSHDFSLAKYSAGHCFDFIKGLKLLLIDFLSDDTPNPLKKQLEEIRNIITKEQFLVIEKHDTAAELSTTEKLQLAGFIRYHFKRNMFDLINIYSMLDAWYGMAMAVKKYKLAFPSFSNAGQPSIKMEGLYHLLLEEPVSYNVKLDRETNFLFLTGANMAGKSTFIKAVGTAVFLAHTGMGVPAEHMELVFFDGLLSNINVMDNILKGESYFYNEVQRIKATINKVNNGKKWLILIDELFKGTNVQDAMKCSSTVIEGLLKIKNSLFILSTHLYEIADELKKYPNICFNYFETAVENDQLNFSYQLKEGISNDRLGYLILKREGVVDLLEKL